MNVTTYTDTDSIVTDFDYLNYSDQQPSALLQFLDAELESINIHNLALKLALIRQQSKPRSN